jgi:hypothetical protein
MADKLNPYLNASHISTNLDNYEAARSGFFTLLVGSGETWDGDATLDTINGIPTAHNRSAGLTDLDGNTQQHVLALNVTKAFVPHFELEELEYTRGNEKVKFAGKPTFQGGDITVDDIVGVDTKSILLAWQAQAYDVHTGRGGRMKHYKKTCKLMEYTQDYELIREWELRGCWIKSISEDPFDKESDGKRQLTASIVYDKAVPINAGYGQYGTRDAL